MEKINTIIQNTGNIFSFDELIIEEYSEPENPNLGGVDKKIYHDLDFYKNLTNKQKEIIDSEVERELDKNQKIRSILLSGESGIGKTVQSILVMRDWTFEFYEKNLNQIQSNKDILAWNAPSFYRYNDILEMIYDMKFGTDREKTIVRDAIHDMKSVRLLVIDDFSSEKSGSKSDWIDNEKDKFFQDVFETRYESENLITIVTSNNTREEISDSYYSWLSKKTLSRLLACTKRYSRSSKTKDLRNEVC